MIDEHDVREMLQRRAAAVPATTVETPTAVRRARRRIALNGAVATVAAVAIVVAAFTGIDAIRSAPLPAVRPSPAPSEDLGVFAPVAGRIVYENEAEVGDLSYDLGLWAIDPTGPSDTTAGPSVADDVASTLVRLDLGEGTPLGWSSDGTELLLSRPDAASAESLFPMEDLFILHADGSETRLNRDPMMFGGATISPDGARVVFAAWGDDLGLWVVDTEGGRPVRLPFPRAEGIVADPTFSPDGTQIAYADTGESENHVWVMDADGSNAHEILADEPTLVGGTGSLHWSPAGDRIVAQTSLGDNTNLIYTFAPDGSDFRQIITGGLSPYWSPDGSQIAYTIECELSDTSCGGLAIADADGSNVREFGFAASGPWHPGTGGGQVVRGWPDTTRNPAGEYSWDAIPVSTYGFRCGTSSPLGDQHSCNIGFMHNGYGSGDVEIHISQVPEGEITDGATAATVAGHDGIYARIDPRRERWIVDIEGTTIAIRLEARPGTSQSDLAEAHAIIESIRTEPRDNDLGFRLVFTLTTDDWDSG
ncbi:MAG TPA: hypothetical protein VI341_09230 [Actinomycetota bacterium]